MRQVTEIIIHCAATKPSMDIGAAEIKEWHLAKGWSDIGYHYVIRRNGQIENGRNKDVPGAHTQGHNANSIGICLVGGINDEGDAANNFTKAQWSTLARLVRILKVDFSRASIHGHNEFSPKACPSFNVQKWLKDENL